MIHIDEELCGYCGSCVAVCPENIIVLVDTHLKIDREECIECGRCLKGCPVGALSLEKKGRIYKNFDIKERRRE